MEVYCCHINVNTQVNEINSVQGCSGDVDAYSVSAYKRYNIKAFIRNCVFIHMCNACKSSGTACKHASILPGPREPFKE